MQKLVYRPSDAFMSRWDDVQTISFALEALGYSVEHHDDIRQAWHDYCESKERPWISPDEMSESEIVEGIRGALFDAKEPVSA